MRPRAQALALGCALSLALLGGCGDDASDDLATDDLAADELSEPLSGEPAGTGILTIEATQHPIAAATCSLGDSIEVATTGGDFQLLLSGEQPDLELVVVGPEEEQYTAVEGTVDVEVDGQTVQGSAELSTETADEQVPATFTVQCP